MTTNVLQDMIARCHQRHEKPLQQQKSIVEPLLYRGLPYHFTVYCAHRYPVMLQDLEAADISFMPIGQVPGNDRPPRSFGGERFSKRQQATDWETLRWHKSWGIHVYTGIPSAREDAPWHDIDFKYEAIHAAPDAVFACVEALVDAVANPLLVMSKSGGLRFSCRIPGYLHPNTQQARLYVHKHAPTSENPHQHDTYLEILGEKGYSCWDARYEILLGDLLDPPLISKEVLFPPIDALRAALHKPIPQNIQHEESIPDAPYSLGSGKLDLAKEAFFKRGFSYIRQADGFHYWGIRREGQADNIEVSLWESEGSVWICASTSDAGLPVEATPITDVWNDTGILPPIPETGLPLDDKVLAIREGKLSPLGVRRPTPVLQKLGPTQKIDETREEIWVQMQRALDRRVSALGFIPDADSEKDGEIESILRNNGAICLNVPDAEIAAETNTFQTTNAQILENFRLFLDPQYAKIAEQTLEVRHGTQPLCIINVTREDQLFLEYELSKTTLEAWITNYQGSAVGYFATALLNAIEIRDKTHANSIKRLRTVVQTFEWLEEEIIKQMCHVDAATLENTQVSPTVSSDPNWTFWHQLKRFFAHYTRDADAPMRWENKVLRFYVPPVLHPSIKHLLVTSPALYDAHLRRAFLDEETEILPAQPVAWAPGNRVFQIRTHTYPRKTILDLYNTWDVFGMSETGQQIFWRIQAEIERDPNVKHGIITHVHTVRYLDNIAKNENVCFLTGFRNREGFETAFQEAEVIWIVGMPEMGPRAISQRSQTLFGNDEEPLSYETERKSYRYKDERVQSVYEKEIVHIFTQVIALAQLNRLPNKKVMLITGSRIPEITDRPETLLFDWADLEVAGGLDKLAEAIATRQRFEAERDNLTDQSSRKEIETVLGCSSRQASRVLQRLRGRKIVRPPLREQILALLTDGEKTTPQLTAAIQGHPKAINTKLTRLVNAGEIVKVRRGVYALPKT